MSDSEDDSFSSCQSSSELSSCEYEDVEWLEHLSADGSLLFIESYVSSTVHEKQILALSSTKDKKANERQQSPKLDKLKKENKLLGLLRRRPSIRGKASEKLSLSVAATGSSKLSAGGCETTECDDGARKKNNRSSAEDNNKNSQGMRDSSPGPKVTFRDNKSGEMRTVALHVVSVGDGRGGLCEAVLGIVAGRFSEPPTDRIMVAGILPGSEAHTTHAIKIGDWLKEINRREVNWSNVDAVLGEIRVPSVVTLGLQKCASETLIDQDHHNRKRITQTQLVKHITGSGAYESLCAGSTPPLPYDLVKGSPPHAALLLSLTGVDDTSPEGADIKYQFPKGSSRLVRVRGVFLTLAHTLFDLTEENSASSTIVSGADEIVHVVYQKEGDLVWVMALPQSYCTQHELMSLSVTITHNIAFEFGGLQRLVEDHSNHSYLDHMLGKVFCSVLQAPEHRASLHHSLQSLTSLPLPHYLHPHNCLAYNMVTGGGDNGGGSGGVSLWSVLAAPPWLLLQDAAGGAKIEVENCLSELEAGNFGDEEDSDCEECGTLLHNIEGCCLFYKGSVICSHLSPCVLQQVYTYARLHGLLQLTAREAVSQLIAWRAVFVLASEEGLSEQRTPCKLLLVATNHLLLAMVLEDTGSQLGSHQRGGPDPFLVEQVEATLFHLQSLHISSLCQESMTHGGPEVLSADERYSAAMTAHGKRSAWKEGDGGSLTGQPSSPQQQTPDVPSILKQRKQPSTVEEGVDCDAELYCQPPIATLVGEEEEDEDEMKEQQASSKSSDRSSLKTSDTPSVLPSLPVTSIRVTTGPAPALFHLLHVDVGDGVLIEAVPPVDARGCSIHGAAPLVPAEPSEGCSCSPHSPSLAPLHDQLLSNFRAACVEIHRVLHSGLFMQLGDSSDGEREHGVLFSYTPPQPAPAPLISKKRNTVPFNYWVVGRVMPQCSREVYVCYHESVPQNLQEMAVKLCLGTTT